MRRLLIALTWAVVSSAHASFELAFVADNFGVGESKARIHRYDTVSGTYLGSFGDSFTQYADIAVHQSTGRLYALDIAGMLTEYDYSTGLALRARYFVAGTCLDISPNGSELYVFNSGTITRLTINTLFTPGQITLAASSGTPRSVTVLGSSIYALCTPSSGSWRVVRYDQSGTILQTGSAIALASTPSKLGSITGAPYATPNYLMAGTGSGSGMLYSSLTSDGQMTLLGTFVAPVGQSWQDVAPLHAGGIYVGQLAADPTKGVVCVANGLGSVFRSFGTSQLKSPVAVATVVAPEPASLAALGLGAMLAIRRRRSR